MSEEQVSCELPVLIIHLHIQQLDQVTLLVAARDSSRQGVHIGVWSRLKLDFSAAMPARALPFSPFHYGSMQVCNLLIAHFSQYCSTQPAALAAPAHLAGDGG